MPCSAACAYRRAKVTEIAMFKSVQIDSMKMSFFVFFPFFFHVVGKDSCAWKLCLICSAGLRVDGRRPPEFRELKCQVGIFKQADGSSFLEQGNTKVLASVYGPHDVSLM